MIRAAFLVVVCWLAGKLAADVAIALIDAGASPVAVALAWLSIAGGTALVILEAPR